MRKQTNGQVDEMRSEYDFSKGVRSKYASQYKLGTNVVLIDPELTAAFPDSKSVNDALRGILDAKGLSDSHPRT